MNVSRMLGSFLVVMAVGWSNAAAQTDVRKLADDIDHRYNGLRSMEAQFTEKYRGNGMERSESGTLWLKKPGKRPISVF